jgi:LuxR family maltose regulon positive regulatory protein
MAEDFENLLRTAELDKAIGNDKKDRIIKYFEQCPPEHKKRHPVALLVYAMALMTFHEMDLFQQTCGELALLIRDGNMDPERAESLTGELSFCRASRAITDIGNVGAPQKGCALLKSPLCLWIPR